MPSFTHAALHTENAPELVAQLIDWRARPDIDATTMESLERRILAHIVPLAHLPVADEEEEAAERPEQLWVLLARRHLAAADDAAREALWSRVRDHLLAGGVRAAGAAEFLRRVPADPAIGLEALFDEQPPLRPALLRIWRDQGAIVPLEPLVRHAEALDPAGRLALVDYAAMRHDVAPDFFTPYATEDEEPAIRAAALRALLVRSANTARPLLQAACAGADDTGTPLLELAALTGEPALLDRLAGPALLALTGLRQAVPPLLDALAEPRTAGPAADAWHWLTGQRLPEIPRLQVVGDPPEPVLNPPPEERESLIPDAAAAQRWWAAQQAGWPAGERRLLGMPMTPAHVARHAARHAGTRGALLHGLLELLIGKPLATSPDTWIAKRLDGYRDAGLLGDEADAQPPAAEQRHG